MKRFVVIGLASISFIMAPLSSSFAYVDPGTGSAVFGAVAYLIAGAGVVAAFFAGFFRKIFGGLFRSKSKQKQEQEQE
jgi:uncharacterized membrane protein